MAQERVRFSDQIRQAIDTAGVSRYAICKAAGIDQAALSRFMSGQAGLQLSTIDVLADVLVLDVAVSGPVRVPEKARPGRKKGE